MKKNKIIVKTQSGNYPIIIGRNLISNISKILAKNSIKFEKCLLVIDNCLQKRMVTKIIKSLKNKNVNKFYFKASEKNKSQKSVDKIIDILLSKNFSRKDCLITIGGGITGDVGGYASSIFKRGMQFINIPTTLLSQVDSSIGGKTGINTKYGKNLIGNFYQPNLVISDIEFLKTLPNREIVCGYAEILKHSLIMSKKLYDYLDRNVLNILKLRSPFIEQSIFKSCKIKKSVVEKDEKEKSFRKMLNFGHTFAHAFEATLGFSKKLNHGEAVILGIVLALKFSLNNKYFNKNEYESVMNHLKKSKIPSNIQNYFTIKDLNKILFFMTKDKKNITNKINLILLKKIGSTIIDNQYNIKKLKIFLKKELMN